MSNEIDATRQKRTQTLIGVWDFIVNNEIIDPQRFFLSTPLVNEVIQHYIIDYEILKTRYNIKGKIQPNKIAGLMASSILRFRPVIPIKKIEDFESNIEMNANEFLAIMHGLAICSEGFPEKNEVISQEPWFNPWLQNFMYLLHHRHHTPESLCFIFATLSYFKFPENIINEEEP